MKSVILVKIKEALIRNIGIGNLIPMDIIAETYP